MPRSHLALYVYGSSVVLSRARRCPGWRLHIAKCERSRPRSTCTRERCASPPSSERLPQVCCAAADHVESRATVRFRDDFIPAPRGSWGSTAGPTAFDPLP